MQYSKTVKEKINKHVLFGTKFIILYLHFLFLQNQSQFCNVEGGRLIFEGHVVCL